VFLNVHPLELSDASLFDPAAPLSPYAHRVIGELTERAALDEVKGLVDAVDSLRSLGFRLAIDDLGAGYAGLSSLTMVQPEFVKLDISLVQGIDAAPLKAQVVRSMLQLCGDLGMRVVAEGVETAGERDTLLAIGADLLQGYLFARPQRGFESPVVEGR
jgi:EAL domain-containing protein (putative c-di-GMP-specific phosphodiesterase class I)